MICVDVWGREGTASCPHLCWRVVHCCARLTHVCRTPGTEEKRKPRNRLNSVAFVVGLTGFEPATSCSQSRRATKLRYSPMCQTAQSPIIPKAKTSTTRHCYSIAISPEFRRYCIVIPAALPFCLHWLVSQTFLPYAVMRRRQMRRFGYYGDHDRTRISRPLARTDSEPPA